MTVDKYDLLRACAHRGSLRGDVPPQKLENFPFLTSKSCNLVNTSVVIHKLTKTYHFNQNYGILAYTCTQH